MAKTVDIEEQLQLNRQLAAFDYQKIGDDKDLTPEAKQRKLGEVYDQALQKHKEIVSDLEEDERKRREQLEQELFSPPRPSRGASEGVRAQRFLSLRGAISRADAASERDAQAMCERKQTNHLSDMLSRAELIGDEHAAYAAFTIARERGLQSIVRQYLASRPEKQAQYEELTTLGTKNKDVLELVARAYETSPPPKPPELLNRR